MRREFLFAGDLAFRNNRAALERHKRIREGEGLPDLVQDLVDSAALAHDAAPLLQAIHYDVEPNAQEMTTLAGVLREGLSAEDAARSLSGNKEMRDRMYTLTWQAMQELRMFADYAFRNDRNNKRRNAFTSEYLRRKNRGPRTEETVTG